MTDEMWAVVLLVAAAALMAVFLYPSVYILYVVKTDLTAQDYSRH